jgi:hypothetical protein
VNHVNRNRLLAYHERILKGRQYHEVDEHLQSCTHCREVLAEMREVESRLALWRDESPLPDTFMRIEKGLPEPKPAALTKRLTIPALPILEIALAVGILLALTFFIGNRIQTLPLWEAWQGFWLVKTIGSLGLALILIGAAGSLVALMLAPVLYLRSHPEALEGVRKVHV